MLTMEMKSALGRLETAQLSWERRRQHSWNTARVREMRKNQTQY